MKETPRRVVISIIGALGLSAALVLPATASTPSASTLISSALRTAMHSTSVHEVDSATHGSQTLTMVNDIGPHEGRQIVTISGGVSAEVLSFVSHHEAYIKGNHSGLQTYFGFPATDAATYAGQWMKMVPSDQGWATVTNATTLSSDFGALLHVLHPVLAPRLVRVNGAPTYAISGNLAASSNGPAAAITLYVSVGSTPRPIRLRERSSGASGIVNWSRWGERLTFTPPANSVPIP